jgi:hypothetical protein
VTPDRICGIKAVIAHLWCALKRIYVVHQEVPAASAKKFTVRRL